METLTPDEARKQYLSFVTERLLEMNLITSATPTEIAEAAEKCKTFMDVVAKSPFKILKIINASPTFSFINAGVAEYTPALREGIPYKITPSQDHSLKTLSDAFFVQHALDPIIGIPPSPINELRYIYHLSPL